MLPASRSLKTQTRWWSKSLAATFIVDVEARNWEVSAQIVSDHLLLDHARNALARISRNVEPDSLLVFSQTFTRRMETCAKMMAEFSEGIIGPMLRSMIAQEYVGKREQGGWKTIKEHRKRPGYELDADKETSPPDGELQLSAPPPKGKIRTEGARRKCFDFIWIWDCKKEGCDLLHEAAGPGEKCPFLAKGSGRLKDKCLLAASHEK